MKYIFATIVTLQVTYLIWSFFYPINSQKDIIQRSLGPSANKSAEDTASAYNPVVLDKISGISGEVTNWGFIENKYSGQVMVVNGGINNSDEPAEVQIRGREGSIKMFNITKSDKNLVKVFVIKGGKKEVGVLADLKTGEWVEVFERLALDKPLSQARQMLEFTIDKGS